MPARYAALTVPPSQFNISLLSFSSSTYRTDIQEARPAATRNGPAHLPPFCPRLRFQPPPPPPPPLLPEAIRHSIDRKPTPSFITLFLPMHHTTLARAVAILCWWWAMAPPLLAPAALMATMAGVASAAPPAAPGGPNSPQWRERAMKLYRVCVHLEVCPTFSLVRGQKRQPSGFFFSVLDFMIFPSAFSILSLDRDG